MTVENLELPRFHTSTSLLNSPDAGWKTPRERRGFLVILDKSDGNKTNSNKGQQHHTTSRIHVKHGSTKCTHQHSAKVLMTNLHCEVCSTDSRVTVASKLHENSNKFMLIHEDLFMLIHANSWQFLPRMRFPADAKVTEVKLRTTVVLSSARKETRTDTSMKPRVFTQEKNFIQTTHLAAFYESLPNFWLFPHLEMSEKLRQLNNAFLTWSFTN